jgi:predicted phage terminase large subunit-like protein
MLQVLKQEQARRNFWSFCLYYDSEFFHSRPFLIDIAGAFQRIADGKILRLQVSLPPRAGKSYITTLFAAWMIGRSPEGSVMRNCCTSTLYEKFSYDTRDVFKSEKFKEVFPSVELSGDKQSIRGWNTSQAVQVSYFGSGVGGTIIGFGATLVAISDDLFKSFDDAISEKVCESTWSWYKGTHGSRIEKNCPVIDIGTRWAKKDVIGRNIEETYYDESIIVPALDDKDQSFCEAVKSTAEYHDIRMRTPREIWMAEYQQNPTEAAGVLYTRADLQTFDPSELKTEGRESVMAYIDVSDEGTDYLAMAVGYVYDHAVYIVDVVFSDANIDQTLPLCVGAMNKHDVDLCRVEANNQGSAFIKMMRAYVDASKILKVNNTANKHTRILMQYGFVKSYFRFIHPDHYERGSDYDRFMNQIFDYVKAGQSKHDDAPDCISGLSKFTSSMLPHLFSIQPQTVAF